MLLIENLIIWTSVDPYGDAHVHVAALFGSTPLNHVLKNQNIRD